MRRHTLLLSVALLGAFAALWPARAQEPLPVSDSLLDEVGRWAERYPNEVVVCMTGDAWHLPETRSASPTHADPSVDCPLGTKVIWHSHPLKTLQTGDFRGRFLVHNGRAPQGPRDGCFLSEVDVRTIRDARKVKREDLEGSPIQFETPWAIVQVTEEIYCWWSPGQIDAIDPVERYNWPPEGQVSWRE